MASTLEMRDVSYSYGRHRALEDVTFTVGQGVVGLLGPNGAGKSTLLSLAATLQRPQAGSISIGGREATTSRTDLDAIRSQIGMLPQRFGLVASMRVIDTVAYAAWVNGASDRECMARAETALVSVGLDEYGRRRVRRLSGGQRQRLGIAAAIAHDPSLLILDEPTVGLDPVARVHLRRTLHRIGGGRTVVLSTHLVEDVVHLCDRILILSAGRLVYDGAPAELASAGKGRGASQLASPLEGAYERLLGEVTGL